MDNVMESIFHGSKSPSYFCSSVLLPLPFFSFAGDSHISNYCFRLLTCSCSDHALNYRSVLIFFCTLPSLFTCTEGHSLWWSLTYTNLLASLFIWSTTVAGSTDMTQPWMNHCHGPSFTGQTIGVEARNHRHRCAGARTPKWGTAMTPSQLTLSYHNAVVIHAYRCLSRNNLYVAIQKLIYNISN